MIWGEIMRPYWTPVRLHTTGFMIPQWLNYLTLTFRRQVPLFINIPSSMDFCVIPRTTVSDFLTLHNPLDIDSWTLFSLDLRRCDRRRLPTLWSCTVWYTMNSTMNFNIRVEIEAEAIHHQIHAHTAQWVIFTKNPLQSGRGKRGWGA